MAGSGDGRGRKEMARQPGRASSKGRVDGAEKGPVAWKRKEGKSSSSCPLSNSHLAPLVAVFRHLFCFGCLRVSEEGDEVLPRPVPVCTPGFLDQEHGVAPPQSDAAVLTYFCPICMERKPAGECFLDLRGCDHVFCAECIAGYVAANVGENAVATIRCPEPECTGGRLEPEDCRPVIPAPVFERWGAALCEAAVGEAERFYCPYRDCSALLWRKAEGERAPMRDAQCGHCGRVCCAHCRVPWHEGLTCREYQRRRAKDGEEGEKVMEMARKKLWQRCPNCGFVVERADGCVFIRCRCQHCFCYRCASPMDPKDNKHYCRKCHCTWDGRPDMVA